MIVKAENRLPQTYDAAALAKLFRDFETQVNLASNGRIQGSSNAATAAPTTGTYQKGDFIRSSSPTEAGLVGSKYIVIGYICITAGTPGTWREVRISTENAGSQFRKNAMINGGFTVNQRGYVSAAVLASGSYGHDRWKAGASGGDYSFTQLPHNTTITIASSKSLIQVVEDKNVVGGSYVLSWTGTAQARAGINSATPAGSFAASPVLIAGQTAGTVMSVEFNTGTLGTSQLEVGSVATEFENLPYTDMLGFCQRYYWKALALSNLILAQSANAWAQGYLFPTTMRAAPTLSSANVSYLNAGTIVLDTGSVNGFRLGATAAGVGQAQVTADVIASAEL